MAKPFEQKSLSETRPQEETRHFLEDIPEEDAHHGGNSASKIVNRYESSIDIFPHDDHLSCDHVGLHFDDNHSHYSTNASTSRSASSALKHHALPALSVPHHHHHHNSLVDDDDFDVHKHLTNEIELIFQNLSHTVRTATATTRQTLSEVSGYAAAGQILAVMGPSGSGKTTLLNLLSGRTKPAFGDITLNGAAINKQIRRRIGYVLQQDIFFANLTLRQTLMYTARLRLPQPMKDAEKRTLVDKLIEELHLQECQHTIIGDDLNRGLSGGEKKRVNIACELLTNPPVMLIDEPTSGLDSCTAHGLVQMIKSFAVKRKKTIIMSVHQPSSQMFYLFDQLLLLSSGKVAYFGSTNGVVQFFNSIGFPISLHYNPADFILEKVKDSACHEKIIEAAKALSKVHKYLDSDFRVAFDVVEHHHHHEKTMDTNTKAVKYDDCWKKESLKSIELHVIDDAHQTAFSKVVVHDNDSGRSSWSEPDRSSNFSNNSFCRDDFLSKMAPSSGKDCYKKWPTSTWSQIKVLTERNFIEARQRMLSKMNWFQTIILGLVAGLIWFRPLRTEETIGDFRGWIFFTTTYWMLFGLFQALVSFPPERQVINKERISGAYRLSSYYIAKMLGELPLTVLLPTVFFFISYPLLGFTSFTAFAGMWLFLILSTVCAQGVGLFIGAACTDLEVSVTTSALYTLSTMLLVGYYSSMPSWLAWARYFSMIYYAFLNMQMLEFSSAPIACSRVASKFAFCQISANDSSEFAAPVHIPYTELVRQLDTMSANSEPFPVWFNTLVLISFLVGFRALGYLVLRYGRKSVG